MSQQIAKSTSPKGCPYGGHVRLFYIFFSPKIKIKDRYWAFFPPSKAQSAGLQEYQVRGEEGQKMTEIVSWWREFQQSIKTIEADIKYLLRIMEKVKILAFLLQFAILPALCTLSSINPANYIWIDFQNVIPVTYKGGGSYTSGLPCTSRIGKCSYDFTVLPPGWSGTKDGTLTIPSSDATKNGIFALQGQFSELTGEKISADLIVKIDNGLLSVVDKADYYQKNGYNLQQDDSTFKSTKYEDSFLVKSRPDGFTPIPQLERKILDGDISNITSVISEVLTKYAPCRSMINYLTEVKSMLAKIMSNNNEQIKTYNDSIKQLELNIKNLQEKKKQQLIKQDSTQEVLSVKKNIDILSEDIVKLRFNESIYKDQAQKNMDALNQYPINVDALNNADLKSVVNQIMKVSKDLETNYNESIKIRKSILETKLKKQQKDVPANFSAPIQAAYNKNTLLLINSYIYLINNDVKTDNSEFLQAGTNGFIGALGKKLDSLNVVRPSEASAIKLIQAENQLLNKNIDYLTTIGKYAQASCK